MSKAKASFGTKLGFSDTEAGTYVDIAELSNVTPASLVVESTDTTNHDSPGGVREKTSTVKDPGEIGMEGNLTEDNADVIDDALGVTKWYQISFPSGRKFRCSGFLSEFTPDQAPVDGKLSFSATVTLSGVWTWVAAA